MGGSLAVGITSLASAASPGSPSVVNQGNAGTSPWAVHDSGPVPVTQSGTWSLGVLFPKTQQVSGTVGIDQTTDGVTNAVHVDNFPGTQVVSGTVKVAGTTTDIADGLNIPISGSATILPETDVSAYKEVTIYLQNNAGDTICNASETAPDGNVYEIGTVSHTTFSPIDGETTFDPAPPNLTIQCGTTTSDTISFDVVGRSN